MAKTAHTPEELNALRVVTESHRFHPDYHAENFFAIATAEGDLEKKARDGFREVDFLPDYIYIPEIEQFQVGDKVVQYALVCGVYSR